MSKSKAANAKAKAKPDTPCDADKASCPYAPKKDKPVRVAKCVVHFRPKKDWAGEDYGFDWMRNTDTGTPGDVDYANQTIGKHYTDATLATPIADINAMSDHFKADDAMLQSLMTGEYSAVDIPWKTKQVAGVAVPQKYFASWMSMYPKKVRKANAAGIQEWVDSGYATNTEGAVSLYLEIEEAPDLLRFEDNAHITISPKEFATKGQGKGVHKMEDAITITCKEEFSSDQSIVVNAVIVNDDKTETLTRAGLLKIWANDASHRRKKKVVLVKVTTNISGVKGNKIEGDTTGQKDLFDHYLKQSLINLEVTEETLDLSGDKALHPKGAYVKTGQIVAYYKNKKKQPKGFVSLHNYLFSKLKAQLKAAKKDEHAYDTCFMAYYLGESGGYMDATNHVAGLNGYSNGYSVMLYPTKNDQTAAHEFLHSFHLPHSFTNKEGSAYAMFTYYRIVTNNVMDYSHQAVPAITRNSTWHWQWIVANAAADPE